MARFSKTFLLTFQNGATSQAIHPPILLNQVWKVQGGKTSYVENVLFFLTIKNLRAYNS